MPRAINFKVLKGQVSLEAVLLDYYGLQTLKRRVGKLIGPCPVHGGDNPRAFHATLGDNVWHCFTGCAAGGDQLTLVAKIDGVSIREAALRLANYFLGEQTPRPPPRRRTVQRASSRPPSEPNRPLSFRLTLQHQHPHLQCERGLSLATCQHFDVGLASRGIMAGCIALPIHDHLGRLIAYAGRRLNSESIAEWGKYRFPRGFTKSEVLFNLHRAAVYAKERGLILVEGFFSAMALHQLGYPNVIAAMGCRLAERQVEQLGQVKPVSVTILFDGNDAGRAGAERARAVLTQHVDVQVVPLAQGHEPEDLSPAELIALFGSPLTASSAQRE